MQLDEPKIKGRFSFVGREYLRQWVDAWGVLPPELVGGRNFTGVGGTGIGKTIGTVAGLCSRIATWPTRALVVKPTGGAGPAGAKSFSKTRLQPCIRATKILAEKIPTGAQRYAFSVSQMSINGSVIDLTGSNSVAQLGENRCDIVLQDEVDKYPPQTEDSKEAAPMALADERMKNVIGARGYKFSTPTLGGSGIWSVFKSTDMRRRFVPCPHCNPDATLPAWYSPTLSYHRWKVAPKVFMPGWVILAWSKRYSVFEPNGHEAFVAWDAEAKVNGEWDYDRVEKSARYQCPHCGGHIKPIDVVQIDAFGVYVATAKNPLPGEIGWHVPSLYSTSPDCAVGKMAVKFLKAKRSPDGVKSFINADLAEPDIGQDQGADKLGAVLKGIEIGDSWVKLMTVDYQQLAPYFWFVIRAWNGSEKTHGIKCGSRNQWHEIDELQEEFKIVPQAIGVDIGFDQAEVLRNCAAINIGTRCTLDEPIQDALPQVNGWNAMKSYGGKRMYRDTETGLWLPWRLKKDVDPYAGSELAHKMRIEVLEWLSDIFEDKLENIRLGKTNLEWSISDEMDTEEYHKQMAAKKRVYNKKDARAYKWETRPGLDDHLHVCEVAQLVLASRLQLISFDAVQTKKES